MTVSVNYLYAHPQHNPGVMADREIVEGDKCLTGITEMTPVPAMNNEGDTDERK